MILRYHTYFTARWLRFAAQVRHFPATIQIVWAAAPGWVSAWLVLLVLQGLLPIPIAYLSRSLANSIALDVRNPGQSLQPTLALAGIMALVFLVSECLQAATTWVKLCQAELVWDHMVGRIQEKSARVRMRSFDSPAFHDQIHRAHEEGPERPLALIESLGSILQDSLTLVAMFAIILPYGIWPPLCLVASTLPAIYLVATQTMAQYQLRLRQTTDSRRAGYYDAVLTSSGTAAEVRLFGLAGRLRARYAQLSARMRDERQQLAKQQAYGEAGAGTMGLAATGLVLLSLVSGVRSGATTLGDLAFFYQAFQSGLRMMRSLLSQLARLYSNSLFLDDLFAFLALPVEAESAPLAARPAGTFRGEIRFRAVTFTYPDAAQPTLRNLNLTIPAAQKVAIVGMNGAGKSTLIRLLCRFYEPGEGEIELDGVPIRTLPVEELRRHISVLFQDPVGYSTTARENIWLGDLSTDPADARVQAAARSAGADGFIEKLPEGYETPLGKLFPGGAELSQGEWHRLALARAYFRRTPVIVLDEPTSAMDPWAELEWLQRFRETAADKTAIIVTHRFSTAMQADVIHLMKDGQITESGSHEELLALDGEYARAWLRASRSGT